MSMNAVGVFIGGLLILGAIVSASMGWSVTVGALGGLVAGIILAVLIFGWQKYGSTVKERWELRRKEKATTDSKKSEAVKDEKKVEVTKKTVTEYAWYHPVRLWNGLIALIILAVVLLLLLALLSWLSTWLPQWVEKTWSQNDGSVVVPAARLATSRVKAEFGSCTKPVLETDYTPSQEEGPLALGELGAGSYKIQVTGLRKQRFLDVNGERVYYMDMEPDGRMPKYPKQFWYPGDLNPERPAPFPAKPYGMVIAKHGDKTEPIGLFGTVTLTTQSPLYLDLNLFQDSRNYLGSGTYHVVIKAC